MEILFIILDLLVVLVSVLSLVTAFKQEKRNAEMRKDIQIVLRSIPATHSAEYVYLVKKYNLKDLTIN